MPEEELAEVAKQASEKGRPGTDSSQKHRLRVQGKNLRPHRANKGWDEERDGNLALAFLSCECYSMQQQDQKMKRST